MTNFNLAPPAKTVDGLIAVPVDIQTLTASLTFDGAPQTGTGDAIIEFTVGPQAGNPIFDLRQTITNAWLDGAPFPVANLAHHDFGGGAGAELRVVEAVLAGYFVFAQSLVAYHGERRVQRRQPILGRRSGLGGPK